MKDAAENVLHNAYAKLTWIPLWTIVHLLPPGPRVHGISPRCGRPASFNYEECLLKQALDITFPVNEPIASNRIKVASLL